MPRSLDLNSAVGHLRDFHAEYGRLPSFSEIGRLLGYSSKSAVHYLVSRLIENGLVEKDASGRLIPTSAIKGGVKVLGTVEAGFPSPAEEELVDTLSLDEYLIKQPHRTFMLKVSGDSMIDAGIHPGDIVLVERGRTAKHGDIVVAQVDEKWTLKRLEKRSAKVRLKAENKKYPDIEPKEELVIGGVVVACVRKYL